MELAQQAGLMARVREWFRWSRGFGPPAGDMQQTLYIHTAWDRGQLGLSVGWVFGDGGRHVNLMLGPLSACISWPATQRALRRELEGKSELALLEGFEADWTVGGQMLTGFVRLQHIGASVQWGRSPAGPAVIARVGPVGAAVQSAY